MVPSLPIIKETNQSIYYSNFYNYTRNLLFFLQTIEYIDSTFTIADSIYGSIFFVATGFHGIHVIIGTLFLIINLLRNIKAHFSNNHHLRFEIAA